MGTENFLAEGYFSERYAATLVSTFKIIQANLHYIEETVATFVSTYINKQRICNVDMIEKQHRP